MPTEETFTCNITSTVGPLLFVSHCVAVDVRIDLLLRFFTAYAMCVAC